MPYNTIEPQKTGVMFFDMLKAGFKKADPSYEAKASIVENCVRVRKAANAHGIPVFFARADHRPDGKDWVMMYFDHNRQHKPWDDPENGRLIAYRENLAGTEGSEVIDDLDMTDEDYMIPKHRKSAFFQTKLELSLRARGIDTLVLCGSAVPSGIAATVYAAQDHDVNVIVVRDACNPKEGEVHDVFMNSVFPRIGRVRTTDEVLEMMTLGANP